VSNLQFLSKLLEKAVLHQLRNQLLTNNLCEKFQAAYRAHHSGETALLDVMNRLLGSADEGQVSVLTLLDLSDPFTRAIQKSFGFVQFRWGENSFLCKMETYGLWLPVVLCSGSPCLEQPSCSHPTLQFSLTVQNFP